MRTYYTCYVARKATDGSLCRGKYITGTCINTSNGLFSELSDELNAKKFRTYKQAEQEYLRRRKYCINIQDGYKIIEHKVKEGYFRRKLYGIMWFLKSKRSVYRVP